MLFAEPISLSLSLSSLGLILPLFLSDRCCENMWFVEPIPSLSLSLPFLQFLVPATCCFECSRHLFPTNQDIDVDGFTHQFLVLGAAKMQNQNPENLIVRLSDSISI